MGSMDFGEGIKRSNSTRREKDTAKTALDSLMSISSNAATTSHVKQLQLEMKKKAVLSSTDSFSGGKTKITKGKKPVADSTDDLGTKLDTYISPATTWVLPWTLKVVPLGLGILFQDPLRRYIYIYMYIKGNTLGLQP